jgi:hypothetical protein
MSRRERPLPGWPLALDEDLAASYLSISVSLFRKEVDAGRMPAPIWVTAGRKVWHRARLKAWLDAKAGIENHPAIASGQSLVDEWDQACGIGAAALS